MRHGTARLLLAVASLLPLAANAQEQEGSFTLADRGGFRLKAGIEAGLQAVTQHDAFWRLGDSFAPGSGYKASPSWGEFYLKPYLTLGADIGTADLYGKVSAVASSTAGTDVFDQSGRSAITLEDAYLGLRGGGFDFSVGSQPYRLGTGMLLSDGGGDGFERGALIFGPRKAWEMTAIGRLSLEKSRIEAFYLDPRELESGDTGTKLVGAALTHELAPGRSFGLAAGQVIESSALWVRAAPGGVGAPTYVPDGRDGLQFLTAWGNWTVDERLSLAVDVAYETNGRQNMAAWAGRVQVSYGFPDLPFQPRIGYSYQTFSGDDPDTARLERFDPLFYDGSPSAWGAGANASLVFLNTNVAAHQIWIATTITQRDYLTFRYFHVLANELLSPLQYGQGTRLDPGGSPTLISGVTDHHLSDDLYAEYTRVLSPNAFLTAGAGVSLAGAGIRELRGGERGVWPGAFANLVFRY
ncbi:hypothetical protein ATER59S_05226 [Aquamicrobium terrae]